MYTTIFHTEFMCFVFVSTQGVIFHMIHLLQTETVSRSRHIGSWMNKHDMNKPIFACKQESRTKKTTFRHSVISVNRCYRDIWCVVKKLPTFYGTRKFCTVFTRARNFEATFRSLLFFFFLRWGVVRSSHACWRTTACRLTTTLYSAYSELPSIPRGPLSTTRARSMRWWQRPLYPCT